jgi:Strictosidine synthase
MDGALKPNQGLDEARCLISIAEPDNLILHGGSALFSSGASIVGLDGKPANLSLPAFKSRIAALAASAEGAIAVALDSGEILVFGGRHDGATPARAVAGRFKCPTALSFVGEDMLLVAEGSSVHGPEDWQRDLLEQSPSGSVWRFDLVSGESICLSDKLAFPYGILPIGDGQEMLVSESWRHRLLRLSTGAPSPPKVVLQDLPGYPARLVPARNGETWICVFAPRSQLIEFTLREKKFRNRMMQEVASPYWIAPQLRSGVSFHEPLQGGAVKQMGILKPWAPTRSYGLVIRADHNLLPVASLHSRADGSRHGITSCLELDGSLLAASKGGNMVLSSVVDS